MSELHLALLAVAVALLVGLFAYGKWQERRMLRRLDAALRRGVGDPLLDQPPARAAATAPAASAGGVAGTARPRLPPVQVTDLPVTMLRGDRVEPRFDPEPGDATPVPESAPMAAEAPGAPAAPASWIEDPLLDWVLELRCAHAVDGVAVIDAAASLLRGETALPIYLVAWDARSQQWVDPDRFGFYSELLVATQLAQRRRQLDEIAASRFVAIVQQLALTLDADFDPPEVARVVAQAAELDQLAARFDVQIGLTLEPTLAPTWDAARVALAARAAGLAQTEPLRWERLTDDGVPVFALSAAALPAEQLALELDVPLAPVAADPLRAMLAAADRLAVELGARLIDDNGRPVNAGSLDGILGQLDALHVEMRAAGIEPGSARARRLYA